MKSQDILFSKPSIDILFRIALNFPSIDLYNQTFLRIEVWLPEIGIRLTENGPVPT
jgi:hypothetical protein